MIGTSNCMLTENDENRKSRFSYKNTEILWSDHTSGLHNFQPVGSRDLGIQGCFYGRVFDSSYKTTTIVDMFLKKRYEEMTYITGSLSFILLCNEHMYIYTGNAHASPLYVFKKDDRIVISDDFEMIATKEKIPVSRHRVAALCWGANCMPYDGIEVLKHNAVYQIDGGIQLSWQKDTRLKREQKSFDEICVATKKYVEQAVASCLTGEKIALALSGGIDSSVLAICLKNLGADFECFHWTSNEFSPINERDNAIELCDKYDIKLHLIDIGAGIRNNAGYIDPRIKYYYPYNHSSFSWWEKTIKEASKYGCRILMSGLNGDSLFSSPLSLIPLTDVPGTDFVWKMKCWWNSWGLPDRTLLHIKNSQTQRSVFEYLFLRRAEFISEDLLKTVEQLDKEGFFMQKESLRVNLFSQYKMECINPFLDQKLVDFCSLIPKYYKSIPVSGRVVQKPALKRAFAEELPFSIYSRTSKSNFGMLSQKFCQMNNDYIGDLLDGESELQAMDIVLSQELLNVLNDDKKRNQNAYALIRACFVEEWLRQRKGEQYNET